MSPTTPDQRCTCLWTWQGTGRSPERVELDPNCVPHLGMLRSVWLGKPLTTPILCQVHKDHSPKSHVNEWHHIDPLGEGGPDTKANKIVVCATGHNNIHLILRTIKKHNGLPPAHEMRKYGINDRAVAWDGWNRIITRRAREAEQGI